MLITEGIFLGKDGRKCNYTQHFFAAGEMNHQEHARTGMKGEKEISRNQGEGVASFHHKQVYFLFPFAAKLLAKGVVYIL